MVKRLLSALEYPQADTINIYDEVTFRKVIIWLEQYKLKKGATNTTTELKNLDSNKWDFVFATYLKALGCPDLKTKHEQLQWLLGLAVQFETQNNRDLYIKHAVENLQVTNVPNIVAENPLDKLNFQSKDFADGITNIAKLLNITPHSNPIITLNAVKKVITARLSPEAQAHPEEVIIKGTPFPFQETDLGFDLRDPILNQAAKVLRILYIHDLRNLQTKANELIVAVQNVTANPKTDTKLGKVGI